MPEIKMIPTGVSKNNPSNGERKVFAAFQGMRMPVPAFCLHSLNIPEHISRKPECEIDFIFINTTGVLCLEVKSGEVSRRNGIWEFKDRNGIVTKKIEGPFEQVKKNMYSLRKRILKSFGESSVYGRTSFGYGVIFTDIVFSEQSVEWDSDIICDAPALKTDFLGYLKRAGDYWVNKKTKPEVMSETDMKQFIDYLRGDFEFSISLSDYLKNTESELIKLTEEQCRTLSALENNQRMLISGAAGTGKTLLALERVKYRSGQGRKVLFLCYSPLLAGYVNEICNRFSNRDLITVANLSGLADAVINCSAGNSLPSKAIKSESITIPGINRTLEAAGRLRDIVCFDDMVIDEGQDLLRGQYFELLNLFLKDGFKSGSWAIFSDKFRQSGVYDEGDVRIERTLREFSPVEMELKCNCRNTRRIAEETEKITNFLFSHVMHDGGREVRPFFYKNSLFEEGLFQDLIVRLIKDSIMPYQINVLTLNSSAFNFVQQFKNISLGCDLRVIDNFSGLSEERNYIGVCSGKDFKGLENSIVIIPDFLNFEDVRLHYVVMTRAKSLLYLFMKESLKVEYERKSEQYLFNASRP